MSEYVQYYLINKDLLTSEETPMSAGKVAGQCARGALLAQKQFGNEEGYNHWLTDSDNKIITLKATEKQMKNWHENSDWDTVAVIDKGYTQIPAGSMTVLVFKPYRREELAPLLKRYRLY